MSKTWMKTVNADFNTDLLKGRIGELSLHYAAQGTLKPLDGKLGDFELKNGDKVEVKTDFGYSMNDTPNLFCEKYRSGNRPGGPWQSLEHGCKYFAYVYAKDAEMLIFETKALVERLELLHDSRNLTLTSVGNKNYVTRGLKIHRDWITDLLLEPKSIGLKFDKELYVQYRDWNKAEPK